MKYPSDESNTNKPNIAESISNQLIAETTIDTAPQLPNFNHNTKQPTIESTPYIPAWTFDFAAIEALTSEELVKSINLAIQEGRFFQPKESNALFFLSNLKSIDENNQNIQELSLKLSNEISNQAQLALHNNDVSKLVTTISRLKTLSFDKDKIKSLEEKLATIKTINKLFAKGNKQINNNRIVSDDLSGAWHTANQMISVDKNNTKTKDLIYQVNNILLNNALRAAEEIDFQMANTQITQAQILSPNSALVLFTIDTINQLKLNRYQWLEQQIALSIEQANVPRANRMLTQLIELGIEQSQLTELNQEIERITILGKYKPLETFSDLSKTDSPLPKMVVMPVGKFTMGSNTDAKNQRPLHNVTINYGFAVSQNEISVEDFSLFIQDSNYITDAEKSNSSRIYDMRTGRLKNKYRINWQKNYMGKKAKKNSPVIHVSWNDAIAYTQWMSEQTGKNYRLLSESEFEYVLRAGSSTYYAWGDGAPTQVIENLTGKLDKSRNISRAKWKKGFEKYNDKYWGPAPVGSFISNSFLLNDTAGNVMEWVMDCWHESYARAPIDGSPWMNPGCVDHVIRGGSWSSAKQDFSSAHRFTAKASFTDARLGFRIAVNLK
ncbi:MAG: formylglycine-generating enzyme family protein [Proteobacteria bacterium]|nr:formylglycine-generating enzyme family protein [Pseudomonadota bacterium]